MTGQVVSDTISSVVPAESKGIDAMGEARPRFRHEARRSLRSGGRRMTHQREVLLEIIDSAEGHLDADELYRRARERDRRISLSTVYRTLSLLKQHDLVDELHLSEEHHHYEAKSGTEHYHVVCQSCGAVEEFASPLTERLKSEIQGRYGFDVAGMDIDVTGRCRRCLAA